MKVVGTRGLQSRRLVSRFGRSTCAPTTKRQSEFVGKPKPQHYSSLRAFAGQKITHQSLLDSSLRSKRSMRLAVHAMQVRNCDCPSASIIVDLDPTCIHRASDPQFCCSHAVIYNNWRWESWSRFGGYGRWIGCCYQKRSKYGERFAFRTDNRMHTKR